jgi:hypothetical protein
MTDTEAVDANRPKRLKPTKPLPTDRISFQKQLDIMRAYAVAYATSARAVGYAEVASIVNVAAGTIALALPFWTDIGLMERSDNAHTPSANVMAFNRGHEWNAETAAHKLAPTFRDSWVGKTLLPRLTFRAMDEKEALEILADAVAASQDYKTQVRMLIEYLVAVGLVERDGTLLRATKGEANPEVEREERPMRESIAATSPPSTNAPLFASAHNRVAFTITVDVDMTELATWDPQRITAFFGGIAQVLAARGKQE